VAEPAKVLGGAASGGAIVDPDERRLRSARLVDRDHREPARERRLDARVVLRHRVDDEAVDHRLPHEPRGLVALPRVRDQQQPGRRL
jgi:hypothetical protein